MTDSGSQTAADPARLDTHAVPGGPPGTVDGETAPGRLIGRYVVIERVGEGGMGEVLRAYDPKLRREVALKRLRPQRFGASEDARLVREAQAMARLNHPHVVAVYDVDAGPTGVMVAMEYVAGPTLRQWLAERPRSVQEIVAAFRAAGEGLAAAHRVGLVHRDFKPSNVLVAEGRILKVTDFGLAKAIADSSEAPRDSGPAGGLAAERSTRLDTITHGDVVMGTPRYMAPEQHTGQAAGAAADQFAFCVALWEALCGAPPFEGRALFDLARVKHDGPPPWPKTVAAPPSVIGAILRGLQPDPAARFATMDELLVALAIDPTRRRRGLVVAGLAAGAVLATALAAYGFQQRRAALCSGADEQLAGVWDDARRQAVHDAVLATGLAYAGDTWTRVEPTLDDYATRWVAQHRAACEATSVRGEQSARVLDLRMACLQRARNALRADVELLAKADAGVVAKAQDLVGDLPSLARCEDVLALEAEVPLPDDPAVLVAVERARASLADARALNLAGKYAEAQQRLELLAPEIEAIAWPPIHHEAALLSGIALSSLGRLDESAAALRQAFVGALQWEQTFEALDAVRWLVYVVGHRQDRHAEGLAYADTALALAEREGIPAEQRGWAHNVVALVLHAQGRYAEAEDELRLALALRLEALGPEHLGIAPSRYNLALVLSARGKYAEAEQELRAALAIFERRLGPGHPDVGGAHNNLGTVLYASGQHAAAADEFRLARDVLGAALGTDHLVVLNPINNLAEVDAALGRYAEAEAAITAVIAARQARLGPKHPHLALSLGILGTILVATGRAEAGLVELRRALEIRLEALGDGHPDVARARTELATALVALGRHDEALAELRQAITIYEAKLDAEHPTLLAARARLGEVHEAQVAAARGPSP